MLARALVALQACLILLDSRSVTCPSYWYTMRRNLVRPSFTLSRFTIASSRGFYIFTARGVWGDVIGQAGRLRAPARACARGGGLGLLVRHVRFLACLCLLKMHAFNSPAAVVPRYAGGEEGEEGEEGSEKGREGCPAGCSEDGRARELACCPPGKAWH